MPSLEVILPADTNGGVTERHRIQKQWKPRETVLDLQHLNWLICRAIWRQINKSSSYCPEWGLLTPTSRAGSLFISFSRFSVPLWTGAAPPEIMMMMMMITIIVILVFIITCEIARSFIDWFIPPPRANVIHLHAVWFIGPVACIHFARVHSQQL